ncbi:MAG: hypothetical protein ACRDKW_12280, partial [Actinomycetota bacterium]
TYRYVVNTVFWASGNIWSMVAIYGPGCPASATYNVHYRMDFDIEGASGDYFWKHDGPWTQPALEHNYPDDGSYDPGGAEWVNFQGSTGRAFYTRPWPTDDAWMYALKFVAGQGDTDLAPLTFPDAFDNNEAIQNTDNVNWYWTHIPYTRPAGCPPTCDPTSVFGLPIMVPGGF